MTLEKNMIEKLKTTLFSVLLVLLTAMTASSAFAAEHVTYIHFDALGSAIAGSDAAGASVWREDYQPYGDRIVSDGSTGNNLWYTGKASYENFGLSYFGARWYDPVVGRFTGIDPVGYQEDNIHSFNRYAYANNNPYKFVDPDGRASIIAAFRRDCSSQCAVEAGTPSRLAAIAGVASVAKVLDVASDVANPAKFILKKAITKSGTKVFHYTDKAGAKAIEKSGVIKPDSKGRVFVTKDKVSASDANNALFMGRGGTKGTHRVEIEFKNGINLKKGTQPNELIHNGSIRAPRQGSFRIKKNDF